LIGVQILDILVRDHLDLLLELERVLVHTQCRRPLSTDIGKWIWINRPSGAYRELEDSPFLECLLHAHDCELRVSNTILPWSNEGV
jgi:hypothetical protein